MRISSKKLTKQQALTIVAKEGDQLNFLEEFLDDYDVVLAAVKNNGFALRYASQRLTNNQPLVLEALTDDGRALMYASASLQDDETTTLYAINHHSEAYIHSSVRLRNQPEILKAALNGAANEYEKKSIKKAIPRELLRQLDELAEQSATPDVPRLISSNILFLDTLIAKNLHQTLKQDHKISRPVNGILKNTARVRI